MILHIAEINRIMSSYDVPCAAIRYAADCIEIYYYLQKKGITVKLKDGKTETPIWDIYMDYVANCSPDECRDGMSVADEQEAMGAQLVKMLKEEGWNLETVFLL